MNKQGIFVGLMLALLCFVIFVNWNILSKADTHLNTIEALRQKNDELVSIVGRMQKEIDEYEAHKDECRQEQFAIASREKQNVTISPAASNLESNFRNLLEDYFQLHRDIMAGNKPPRFAQCVLLNGWGNVLQEAISCFLFAFVSNRAVIFNTSPISGYMPFEDFLSKDKMPIDGYNVNILNGRTEYIVSRHDLLCMNFDDYEDKEWITIHLTYDYFAPNILSNPNHGEALLDVLPANYFQIIFGYLFHLKEDILADVEKFKKEHFGSFNIGIQIRHPTKTLQGEKDHKGFPVPPLDLYAEAAEQLSRFQGKVPYKEVVWFVATQNTELIADLQSHYGRNKVVSYNGTITTTFDVHSEGQRVSLITWWLLGECDEVITTEASSYGTTAGARNGLFPIVCTHQKFCFRRLSQTPCQDTQFLAEQPLECLLHERKLPHQFLSSPENSCGYFKYQIYTSPEYKQDSWSL